MPLNLPVAQTYVRTALNARQLPRRCQIDLELHPMARAKLCLSYKAWAIEEIVVNCLVSELAGGANWGLSLINLMQSRQSNYSCIDFVTGPLFV